MRVDRLYEILMKRPRSHRSTVEGNSIVFMAASVYVALAGRSTPRLTRASTAWLSPLAAQSITASSYSSRSGGVFNPSLARRHRCNQDASFHNSVVLSGISVSVPRSSHGLGFYGLGTPVSRGRTASTAQSARRRGMEGDPVEQMSSFGTAYHVPVVCKEVRS